MQAEQKTQMDRNRANKTNITKQTDLTNRPEQAKSIDQRDKINK